MKLYKHTFTALLILGISTFFSCQEPIFYNVRTEVPLGDRQISGTVYSLVRHRTSDSKEYLFAANGRIWKKDVTESFENGTSTPSDGHYEGHWDEISKPENSGSLSSSDFIANRVEGLASNSSNELYALSIEYGRNDDSENQQYYYTLSYSTDDGASWKTVQYYSTGENVAGDISSSNSSIKTLFSTNTPKSENRKAFANLKGKIYLLEGGIAKLIYSSSTSDTIDSTSFTYNGLTSSSKSVATFNGNTFYFSDGVAMNSNETKDENATYLYKSADSDVQYSTDGTTWTTVDVNLSTLESIAYYEGGLLCGTTSGVQKVSAGADGKPANSLGSLFSNTSTALSTYYEVSNILVIDPSTDETGTDFYASLNYSGSSSSTNATNTNRGLWSYYPGRDDNFDGTGDWNRE